MARPGIMERDWASPSPWCVPEEGNFNIVFARAVQARTHGKRVLLIHQQREIVTCTF